MDYSSSENLKSSSYSLYVILIEELKLNLPSHTDVENALENLKALNMGNIPNNEEMRKIYADIKLNILQHP